MSVKAKCRVCSKEAPADQFKLHYKFRQMVCPDCYSGRTEKKQQLEKKQTQKPAKPPGWDAEDEYLEKMARLREKEQRIQFTKIPGTDYVKCKCLQCKFEFRYDPFRKLPRACPYCSENIPKLNTFSML